MANPYSQKLPIKINELPTYRKYIETIVQYVADGHTLWITGDRLIRSSVLRYLASTQNSKIFDDSKTKSIISLIESPLLGQEVDKVGFWKACFAPFDNLSKRQEIPEPIISEYKIWQQSNFDTYKIQNLLDVMCNHHYRIILLFNEFDYLLDLAYPHRHFEEGSSKSVLADLLDALRNVYGNHDPYGLRLIVSSYSNHRIGKLASRNSHPFFANMFLHLPLPPISQREMASLLNQPDSIFTAEDRKYIFSVAGKNLHILRITADILWKEKTSSKDMKNYQRYVEVGNKVHELTKPYYSALWGLWDIHIRKAVIIIGLSNVPNLIRMHNFSSGQFQKDLSSLQIEVKQLVHEGVISEPNDSGSYTFIQGALLWWLADELAKMLRKEQPLEEWFLQNELKGGLITQGQLDGFSGYFDKVIVNSLPSLFEKGVSTFIEAYAKALVR